MIVRGIDFTSRPTRRKPITCCEARLEGDILQISRVAGWTDFSSFEEALRLPGPWIAGLDLPFGQARRFIETAGWPGGWQAYVEHVANFTRQEFRDLLDAYRRDRAPGNREHRRQVDRLASAISPQKLYGVPVALMFFEGVTRLAASGAHLPGLKSGDPERIVVEAYPGVLARRLVDRRSYKNDDPKRQSPAHRSTREDIIRLVRTDKPFLDYGLAVDLPESIASEILDDGSGDRLDALLCAIQAGWAWTQRDAAFGCPHDFDPLEGWIADPSVRTS